MKKLRYEILQIERGNALMLYHDDHTELTKMQPKSYPTSLLQNSNGNVKVRLESCIIKADMKSS